LAIKFSLIIPTRDRRQLVLALLESVKQLHDFARIDPEVIVGDNGSQDDTWTSLQEMTTNFPVTLHLLQEPLPGKSRVLNRAIALATGDILAFLDDDVVVDHGWLKALEAFFADSKYQAGQGRIGLSSPEADDPEIQRLLQRYRTIPHLDYNQDIDTVHSLNGANCFVRRELFNRIGGFDERLGPGGSGTSEDVDLARRLISSGARIGYARDCLVYHHVDRDRLTDEYFEQNHRRQGASRLLIKNRSYLPIVYDLGRATFKYFIYRMFGSERKRYRNKGRIYHYLGMIAAKRNGGVAPSANVVVAGRRGLFQ
jgi:glucosyl-dolichyl phosphate glucuronosyltransferase